MGDVIYVDLYKAEAGGSRTLVATTTQFASLNDNVLTLTADGKTYTVTYTFDEKTIGSVTVSEAVAGA